MSLEVLKELHSAVARHEITIFERWRDVTRRKGRDNLLGPAVTVWVVSDKIIGRVMGPITFLRNLEERTRVTPEITFPQFDPATWFNPDNRIEAIEVDEQLGNLKVPDSLFLLVRLAEEPPADGSQQRHSRKLPFPSEYYLDLEIPYPHIQRWTYEGSI